MTLTTDEFHDELEATTRREARRQLVIVTVQTVVLVSLVLWALYTSWRVAHDLEAARAEQRSVAAQNELQTRILCQQALQVHYDLVECDPFTAVDTRPGKDPAPDELQQPPPGETRETAAAQTGPGTGVSPLLATP